MLPHIDAKDGLTARVLGANHKGIVLIWCGLNGKRAVLGNRQPGPACMQVSQLSSPNSKVCLRHSLSMSHQLYDAAGRQAGNQSHCLLTSCDMVSASARVDPSKHL